MSKKLKTGSFNPSLPYYPYYSVFPDRRLESQICETASHSATSLHSEIDPYPMMCSARFGGDLDYRSGSRAKSVFSDLS